MRWYQRSLNHTGAGKIYMGKRLKVLFALVSAILVALALRQLMLMRRTQ